MYRSLRLTAACAVVITFMAPCLVQAADPPNLDIPLGALSGSLAEYEGQIVDRVQYWSRQIADANSVGPIAEARKQLIQDYGRYRETAYRETAYPVIYARVTAEELVKILSPGFGKGDALRVFKQISAAVAISRMPQTTTSKALAVMVTHESPAVRYLGWDGYRRSRGVLSARSAMIKKAIDGLQSAAAKEQSAAVVGAIFEMFNIPTPVGAPADPVVKKRQGRVFTIIEANWDRWCRKTRNGDLEMSRAMARGVRTLQTLSKTVSAQTEDKKRILQMLCDLMLCSSKVWDIAGEGSPLLRQNGEVLRVAEELIVTVSGKEDVGMPVTNALLDTKEEDLGARLGSLVYDWIEKLEEFGVVEKE